MNCWSTDRLSLTSPDQSSVTAPRVVSLLMHNHSWISLALVHLSVCVTSSSCRWVTFCYQMFLWAQICSCLFCDRKHTDRQRSSFIHPITRPEKHFRPAVIWLGRSVTRFSAGLQQESKPLKTVQAQLWTFTAELQIVLRFSEIRGHQVS